MAVKGSQAVLTGAKGTVTITTDGPAITLGATPRTFAKNGSQDWVFGKSGVPWQTLEGTYPADPAKPLITVFAPAETGSQPATATITRTGDGITVMIGGNAVKSTRLANGWSAVKPYRGQRRILNFAIHPEHPTLETPRCLAYRHGRSWAEHVCIASLTRV
jgi:hypothetical protein